VGGGGAGGGTAAGGRLTGGWGGGEVIYKTQMTGPGVEEPLMEEGAMDVELEGLGWAGMV